MEKYIAKIGIDVDDCICNTLEMDFACAQYLNNSLKKVDIKNVDETYYDVTKTFNMSENESDSFYKQEKDFIMKNNSMYPKVFVKEVISFLHKKGFQICFITSRLKKYWKGDSLKPLKKWLKKYHIFYDKIYANVESKDKLCKEIGINIMIEDRVDYVQKVNEMGINTILIRQKYNENYSHPLNNLAYSWLDVYKILGEKYKFDYQDIMKFNIKAD